MKTTALENMIRNQLKLRGISNQRVLKAMERVPRHLFIDASQQPYAYEDGPLPIGHGQTISQPYIVAFMTEALQVEPNHTVLEIGTGSGYQAAILSLLAERVVSLETIPELARTARKRLIRLGYDNVDVHCTDGKQGWPRGGAYDRIIVTAAPQKVPQTLLDQLAPGGTMVLPVGKRFSSQVLQILSKDEKGVVTTEQSLPVRFVPLV